jgi:hypothetical protein
MGKYRRKCFRRRVHEAVAADVEVGGLHSFLENKMID